MHPNTVSAAPRGQQAHALHAGQRQLALGTINHSEWELYEYIVTQLGASRAGEVPLSDAARALNKHPRSVSRYFAKLEKVQLVARGPVTIGGSWETRICAYNDPHGSAAPQRGRPRSTPSDPAPTSSAPSLFPSPVRAPAPAAPSTPVTPPRALPPRARAQRSDTYDRAYARLQALGVTSTKLREALAERPLEQIDAVVAYANKCRTPDDPRRVGLIVFLLKENIWPDAAADASINVSTAPVLVAPEEHTPTAVPPADEAAANDVPDPRAAALWASLREQARTTTTLDPVWFDMAVVLELSADTVVIGTVNVLVRDELRDHADWFATQCTAWCGTPITVLWSITPALMQPAPAPTPAAAPAERDHDWQAGDDAGCHGDTTPFVAGVKGINLTLTTGGGEEELIHPVSEKILESPTTTQPPNRARARTDDTQRPGGPGSGGGDMGGSNAVTTALLREGIVAWHEFADMPHAVVTQVIAGIELPAGHHHRSGRIVKRLRAQQAAFAQTGQWNAAVPVPNQPKAIHDYVNGALSHLVWGGGRDAGADVQAPAAYGGVR